MSSYTGAAILETDIYNTDPRIFDYATGNNYEVGGNYTWMYIVENL